MDAIFWSSTRNKNNKNFVTITSDISFTAFAVRYISTAIVLGIATLFNTLDFAIATITPFGALVAGYRFAGSAPAKPTLLFNIVNDLPPIALYKSLRHKHTGAALSLVASTIGSLLTIVTSGLWVFNPSVEIVQSATATLQSTWSVDFNSTNITNSRAPKIFNEIAHGGTNNATLIWDTVVLPVVGDVEVTGSSISKTGSRDSSSQYNFIVPAIQPVLNCSVLPQTNVSVFVSELEGGRGLGRPLLLSNFAVTTRVPTGCVASSMPNTTSMVNFSSAFDAAFTYDGDNPDWVGFIYDLPIKPASISTFPVTCPSLGVIFGTFTWPSRDVILSNITALMCTQQLQLVKANVTYFSDSLSALGPILTPPVRLTPNPATLLADPNTGRSSLSYPISNAFGIYTTGFTERPRQHFDNFFEHLTSGPNGTVHEALVGESNAQALIDAMKKLYQKLMLHVIDLDYRSSDMTSTSSQQPGADVNERVKGTTTAIAPRLKISELSKIVLQALLAAMVVLGGLAYWFVDLRNTLPRNPYPIANSLAFFAGSTMLLGDTGEGLNRRPNVRLRAVKRKPVMVMKGKSFGLGWWQREYSATAYSDEVTAVPVAEDEEPVSGKRFGIDIMGYTIKAKK
ncbi:hypothetical protein CIB48_g6113 [Xylaria polymorpha]|nr:hypothetical protein CIB48_g6113 [Xylaria polymorpha]